MDEDAQSVQAPACPSAMSLRRLRAMGADTPPPLAILTITALLRVCGVCWSCQAFCDRIHGHNSGSSRIRTAGTSRTPQECPPRPATGALVARVAIAPLLPTVAHLLVHARETPPASMPVPFQEDGRTMHCAGGQGLLIALSSHGARHSARSAAYALSRHRGTLHIFQWHGKTCQRRQS